MVGEAELFREFFRQAFAAARGHGAGEEFLFWVLGSALASMGKRMGEHLIRLGMARMIRERLSGKVIDIGCGTGAFTLYFAAKEGVEEVVGIDREVRFEAAEKAAGRLGLPVEFHAVDFLEYRPKSPFDHAVLLYVLHDLDDPGLFLGKAMHLVRGGGEILIGDVDFGTLRDRIAASCEGKGLALEITKLGELETHGKRAVAFGAVIRR